MELRCEDEEDPEMDAYVVLLLRKLRSARVRAVQAECGDTKELARGWRAQIVDEIPTAMVFSWRRAARQATTVSLRPQSA